MRRALRQSVPFGPTNFLSVFQGIEGGFAIFSGIVLGLSFGEVSRQTLVASAVISIVVSALNSATVRFSSEHYLDELDGHEARNKRFQRYFVPAALEFVAYTAVSLLALVPLLIVNDLQLALLWMCLATSVLLFVAGWYRGHLLAKRHAIADGFEVLCGGAIIMLAGALSGWALTSIF